MIGKEAVDSACVHVCADEQRNNEQVIARLLVFRGGAIGR